MIAPIPPILLECCDGAIPFDRPFVDRLWLCGSDGRMAVRAPVERFDWSEIKAMATTHSYNTPPVGLYFRRWKPGGRTLALPPDVPETVELGGGVVLNRRRVRLGPVSLAAYRVARLVRHGVREVESGPTAADPVRFACGEVEGLLMPLVPESR
jgi:hypothetical protein